MTRRRIVPSCIAAILFLLLFLLVTPSLFAELINDGSFENSPETSAWEEFSSTPCNPTGIGDWSAVGNAPANFDGQQSLWVGGTCGGVFVRNNGARQTLSLQESAALLSFWFNPVKVNPELVNSDRAIVSIDGTTVWDLDVNGQEELDGWNNAIVDIGQYADQTITLSLEIRQGFDPNTANVFFDYIEILHPAVVIDQLITPTSEDRYAIEITVTNNGDTDLKNFMVTNSNFANCDRGVGSLPDLASGDSTTYSCEATDTADNVENTATVQATATEIEYPVEASHTASASDLTLLLTLAIEPGSISVPEGDAVQFSLSLTNNGSTPLTEVQISSAQVANCNFTLDSLAVSETAVSTCIHTPSQSGTIIFTATAVEPTAGREVSVETAVTIELLPTDPPSFPTYTQYIPVVTNNFINHSPLGEPNDVCDQAYPLATNQAREFLAEDIHDWYTFTLDSPSNLTVSLTNFVPIAGQITIWQGTCQNLTFLGQNGDFATTKSITLTNQTAGTYYVWVINDGPVNTNDKYGLSVMTP
ncbi:MAG: hypothetical protein CL608_13545 [Anaerolineaceae bacterium]|nr:hypothetical protein [Anaerolineaceae bacterium]